MKFVLSLLFAYSTCTVQAQKDSTPTLRTIVLQQLQTTHNVKDWFVPPLIAVAGLSAEQANWKDSSGNHSIAQLVTHLIFWDKQTLDKFVGKKQDTFDGNNKETFTQVTEATWKTAVLTLDSVLTALEVAVKNADDAKLKKWYSTFAHIGTHNAYHTGQIIYVRKLQGSWNPAKGMK